MSATKEYTPAFRAAGAVLALLLGIVLTFVCIVGMSIAGVREKALVTLATAMGPALAGIIFVGWKKPGMFIEPLRSCWQGVERRLVKRQQRALFLFSLPLTLPWLLVRVIGQTFETSSIAEYGRSAYYPLINTVFWAGSWGYEPEWYEWLFVCSMLGVLVSLFWSNLVEPLVRWVRGSRSDA